MAFRKGSRRLAAVSAGVVLLAAYSASTGGIPWVGAIFTADTGNQNAVASGGWIPAPSGTASAVGGATNQQLSLSWTSGKSAASPSPNPVTGQTLEFADGGSGASASCGAYSSAQTLAATATSTTAVGSPVADWWCYEIESTSGAATTSGSWTSAFVTFPPQRLLVPTSVAFSGNGNGKLENGEHITITFNQNVASSSVAIHSGICQVKGTSSNGYVILGFTGTCKSTAAYAIGRISGITVNKTGSTAATVSVAGATVTITATAGGQNITTGGTFVAAATVTASSGTPAACTSASAPTCTVTPTGGF
jgi:hypothetical protein